jgi:hypothetical protein
MSEPEPQFERQPELLEEERVPAPTDGSPILEQLPGEEQTLRTRPGGEGGKYVCSICGKSFNSKAELTMHTESLHKSAKKTPPRQGTENA